MANQALSNQVKEKIRETLEKLAEALDGWLNKQRPQLKPSPLPVDRPTRKRR